MMKRKFLGFLTAMALAVNLVPLSVFAVEEHENQVHVIVENTTFTPDSDDWDDKFWYGTLVDTWIDINDDSTMMTCIVDAIEGAGYTQTGAESNYISYINGMGEFDGGFMSGWMGTLNDWFTNEGFAAFTVAEGELETGDEIRVMYTCAYGDDLGGSWGNSDSTIKNITFDNGTLSPAFDKDTHEYTLTVPSYTKSIFVTPTASNKNYQVRTRIGDTEYKRTRQVPVSDGTEIIVECNYDGSLSMNTDGETNTYTINVKKESNIQSVPTLLNEVLNQLSVDVSAPAFGTSAGEWSVLCLARGNYFEKDNVYFKDYYDRIVSTVNETASSVNMNGALHKVKSTENSRLIVALSSIGMNAEKVGDWNLITPYNDFEWIKKQGINGPIWALIALDTNNYQTTDSTIRQQCIDYLLEKQTADGGWTFSGKTADPDMTAMTLQAFSRYTDNAKVAEAVEKGVNALSSLQKDNGGYASWGSINSESIAQVITACTVLGINPDTDERFIKNGNSAVDALLTFYNSDNKRFSHIADDSGNGMATDQATYALVAYQRFVNNQNSLYDMTDVELDKVSAKFSGATLSLSGNIGVNFHMELDDSVVNDKNAYMQFTLPNGDTTKVMVSDAVIKNENDKKYYVFSCEVAAKEMSDTITAQIYSGNNTAISVKYRYSVAEYAGYIKANSSDFDDKTKKIVDEMTNYGNYAKAYFDGTELDETEEMKQVTAENLSAYTMKSTGTLSKGITYYGSSLLLESETTLRHYFKVAEGTDVSVYKFSGNKGNYYYIDITDISADRLDDVCDTKTGGYTVTYCPMSYAYAVLSSDKANDSLKNVVKALYLYNQAANAYKQ